MFTTDLPLSERPEKVGERRQRKAQERSHAAHSIDSTKSPSRSSISTDREHWWGFRKAKKASHQKTKSAPAPPSPRSPECQDSIHVMPKDLNIRPIQQYKDPVLQPGFTYATTLSPKLPSGAPLNQPQYEVSEPARDTPSRYTESIDSRFSCKMFYSLVCWRMRPNRGS